MLNKIKSSKNIFAYIFSLSCLSLASVFGQTTNKNDLLVADKIVAIVGDKMIKFSEVENQIDAGKANGILPSENSRCEALQSLLLGRLYALQAEEDSIYIPDEELESQLDARIRYFVQQIGSREKLEAFYHKSILEIKEENRASLKQSMIAQKMEAKITEDVKVTPSEVKKFYYSLNQDSIPYVPMQYELGVIIKKIPIGDDEKALAKQKIDDLRERIVKGESFTTLAALYSEDPGSARKGGDLGYGSRGEWAPEFESMAFSLKKGELSPVIETTFGYHILQMLDKKGEMVHIRHILIRPQVSILTQMRAKTELDSVSTMIREGDYTFDQAVKIFSDEAGKQADGIYLSSMTRKPRYSSSEIEPSIVLSVEKLNEGGVTPALPFQDEEGNAALRIFYVIKKYPPHSANLKDDYDQIYSLALEDAKKAKMQEWMKKKVKSIYIRVFPPYKDCGFSNDWK